MSVQGFILVKLTDNLSDQELWELIVKYESINGVDFASRVTGPCDFVLTVDAEQTLERIMELVRDVHKAEIQGLKISDVFVKHREIQNLKILQDLGSSGAHTHRTSP